MSRLLQDLVAEYAKVRPDGTSVVMRSESLTYGELDVQSNRLARLLIDQGCLPGDRVCLFVEKSPRAILAMISVLRAGAIYVPLDLESPAPRTAKILESCEPRCVLVDKAGVERLDQLYSMEQVESVPVIALEAEPLSGETFHSVGCLGDLDGFQATAPAVKISDGDPAHILFTSGSTGTPKGVVVTHRNVLGFVDWAVDYFGMSPGERVSGHSPLHFDLSTFDIYGSLAAGGELWLVPPEFNLIPNKLAEFIRDAELIQWFSVPSALNFMANFDVIPWGGHPRLKRLLWCGEVLPTPTLIYWMKRLPHVSFTNLYGPTESTIASSYYTVPECPVNDKASIPIGKPCGGEDLLVLDEDRKCVPAGETGDLYLIGVGLTRGYWRDPEKTDAVFVHLEGSGDRVYQTGDLARMEENGLVYFLGRSDSQIKSRGYRIELGEIESALNTLEQVRACAVVAVSTGGFEGSAICCAYVTSAEGVTPVAIRKALSELLPRYMLPSRWRAYESMPETSNGKTNRRVLREEFEKDENPTAGSR